MSRWSIFMHVCAPRRSHAAAHGAAVAPTLEEIAAGGICSTLAFRES